MMHRRRPSAPLSQRVFAQSHSGFKITRIMFNLGLRDQRFRRARSTREKRTCGVRLPAFMQRRNRRTPKLRTIGIALQRLRDQTFGHVPATRHVQHL